MQESLLRLFVGNLLQKNESVELGAGGTGWQSRTSVAHCPALPLHFGNQLQAQLTKTPRVNVGVFLFGLADQ